MSESSQRRVRLDMYAQQLRAAPASSEARFWEALRGQRLGAGFQWQVVIEGFHPRLLRLRRGSSWRALGTITLRACVRLLAWFPFAR